MSPRSAIIFTALFLVLFPIYRYVDRPPESAAAKVEEQEESLLKLNAIDSLTLTRGSETLRFQMTPDGKLFQLVQPQGAFVPQDLMQALASLLVSAKEVEVVSEDINDLAQFGLDIPRSEMTIVPTGGTGQPVHLYFGAENPTHTAIYARIEGIPKVFLLGRNLEYYESVMFEWVEGKQGKGA
ncbi:MAG: DUF4340 domain-containing protein [Candidatus Binataceae bacterium]